MSSQGIHSALSLILLACSRWYYSHDMYWLSTVEDDAVARLAN